MEVKVFKGGMKIVYAPPGTIFSSLPQHAQDFLVRCDEEKDAVLDPNQTYLFDVEKVISEVQSQGYALVEIELSLGQSQVNQDGTLTLTMGLHQKDSQERPAS